MGWGEVGSGGKQGGRADLFVNIERDKPKKLHIYLPRGEEPYSFWSHWIPKAKRSVLCVGKKSCPACAEQVPAKMRHAVNVWDYDESKLKVLEQGNKVFEQLKLYFDMYGSFSSIDVVIKKTGEQLNTQYVVAAMPCAQEPAVEAMHDLLEVCGTANQSDVAKVLGGAEAEDEDDVPFGDPDEVVETPKARKEDTHTAQPELVAAVDDASVLMPHGKYAGKTLGEVMDLDKSYLEWVAKEFGDEEVRFAAANLLSFVAPKVETPKPRSNAEDAKKKAPLVEKATALIRDYKERGGELKNVAILTREIAGKTLLKEFTVPELEAFISAMENTIEALQHE